MTALGKSLWRDNDSPQELVSLGEDYEILGEIARGGMGVVYHARHLRLKRDVALKMIRDGRLTSDSAAQRFQVEAETGCPA